MAARAQTERVGMARNAVVCETAAQTLALAFLRLLVFSAAAGMEAEGIVGWAVAGDWSGPVHGSSLLGCKLPTSKDGFSFFLRRRFWTGPILVFSIQARSTRL